jgi:hypothetical protein
MIWNLLIHCIINSENRVLILTPKMSPLGRFSPLALPRLKQSGEDPIPWLNARMDQVGDLNLLAQA